MEPERSEFTLSNAVESLAYIMHRVKACNKEECTAEATILRETLRIAARLLQHTVAEYARGMRPNPGAVHEMQQLLDAYQWEA